ncbi:MAG: Hsp20/alpha crystallin family protein [Candidatus Paceibacterota bacterium]
MPRRKKSFFERLTGGINTEEQYEEKAGEHDDFHDEFDDHGDDHYHDAGDTWDGEDVYAGEPETYTDDEGELAVDVYETPEHIVVQAMVAGVRPDALDVSITREQCVIRGRREAPSDASLDEYLHRELYWGSFSRAITLPEEVEVEESNAAEDHGLLTITLPKINKHNETKLEIKSQ